jgi:anti-sigma factor RsiW
MREEAVTDELLRQYLLGNVDDEERLRIERLFITDPVSRERLLAIEEDLIEDYLEDSLTKADRERFLSQFAQTPEQQQKLRITKSIKDWAVREGLVTQTGPATIWSRLRTRLSLKPLVVIPIAVTIVIAIVVAAVWLQSKREQRQHLAIEQELARLNSPASLREVPPHMVLFELSPVTLRSVEPQSELESRAGIELVELRLLWIQKDRYATYQAEVSRVGDDRSFMIRNLEAENDQGYAIRIRLRVDMLGRGLYQIQLTGIAADGVQGQKEDYSFTVGG